MTIELIAPAKLNLVLEVLGRRPDGYHDVASVMQTIDLADSVRLEKASSIEIAVSGEARSGVPQDGAENLAFRAAQALARVGGRTNRGVRIELEKRIPAGMGLGGGSTDAAAVLRGLNRLWELDWEPKALEEVAAELGSDVTFFLYGGTAAVSGRGERVEPLPDLASFDITLLASTVNLEDKTRHMYGLIGPDDFSDGQRTRRLLETARRGEPVGEGDLHNAFTGHIGQLAAGVDEAMARCRDAGLAVVAAGSGPGFFTLAALDAMPPGLVEGLDSDFGVRAIGCRTLGREVSTAMQES